MFLDQNMQLEGSFGYLNHFGLRQPPNPFNPMFGIAQPAVRGFLYDVNATYNFGERQFLNKRISPFLTVGSGGLTTSIPDASAGSRTHAAELLRRNHNVARTYGRHHPQLGREISG